MTLIDCVTARLLAAALLMATCGGMALGAPAGEVGQDASQQRASEPVMELRPPAPQPGPDTRWVNRLREAAREAERETQGPAGDDPLIQLERRTAEVVDLLTLRRTDELVQQRQREIVATLDELIAQLEAAQNAGGQGQGQGHAAGSPTAPASDSSLRGGADEQGELRRPRDARDEWADLPPRERDRIMRSRSEGFPAGYESVLEDYFRRLAEEQTHEGQPDDASPSTDPQE